MPGPFPALTVFLACLFFIAGCTNPSGSRAGGATITPPTSEPTPLLPPLTVSLPPAVTPIPLYVTVPAASGTPVNPVYTPPSYGAPYQNSGSPSYGGDGNSPGTVTGYIPASSPVPEQSDPADIVFQHYSDQYFGIDYPTGWTVTRTNYVRLADPGERVTFTAEVYDFPEGLAGNYRLNPDISAVQDLVSREFPGYAAGNIISNYQNAVVHGIPATAYTVRLPDGSLAYTRYILVSLHHSYQFTFTADTATFDNLAPLRNYMFGTLTVSDQVA